MTRPMFGSNHTPFSASSASASALARPPCSTTVQSARAARIIASGACAWTIERSPCARGLAARGVELRLRQRRHAAVADAGRGEDLDQVGAVGLELPHLAADLVGRQLGVGNLAERARAAAGPGMTPRASASRSGLSDGRADALHGGEAGHQRDVGVLGAVERGLVGRLRPGRVAAVGVEVPADVHVRVDEAGQQREAGQVVGGGAGRPAPTAVISPPLTVTITSDACRRGRRACTARAA